MVLGPVGVGMMAIGSGQLAKDTIAPFKSDDIAP
jgi:hypothetical protein